MARGAEDVRTVLPLWRALCVQPLVTHSSAVSVLGGNQPCLSWEGIGRKVLISIHQLHAGSKLYNLWNSLPACRSYFQYYTARGQGVLQELTALSTFSAASL